MDYALDFMIDIDVFIISFYGPIQADCIKAREAVEKYKILMHRPYTKLVLWSFLKRRYTEEISDLLFAAKVGKHLKSNTIVLARDQQLIGMGCGQTSRVDALKQAILKAQQFGFDVKDSVMASDAFFPFPDCVEIADKAGVTAVIQPGGSIKDQLSIDYCDEHQMAMVMTGVRHFKH